MKVRVEITEGCGEACAVIYASAVTEEVQKALELLGAAGTVIAAWEGDTLRIVQPEELYMVRIEGGETLLYGRNQRYRSRKRLYEIAQQIGNRFLQISKTTLVNLSYLDSVEAGFSGTLSLKLKNGCRDYVTRKYLKAFRNYLGI